KLDGSTGFGIFPYIIVYNPIEKNKGEVAIGIYSSKDINNSSNTSGFESEGAGEDLPPFIIRIKGEVKKDGWNYIWTKGPEIDIIFDEKVPHFEFKEETISDKIESSLDKIKGFFGKTSNKFKEAMDLMKEGLNGLKSLITDFNILGQKASVSSVVSSFSSENNDRSLLSDLDFKKEVVEDVEELEIELEAVENSAKPSFPQERDRQEELDDIAERIDSLSQEIKDLMAQVKLGDVGEVRVVRVVEVAEVFAEPEAEEPEPEPIVVVKSSRSSSGGAPAPVYCSKDSLGSSSQDKVIFDEIRWEGTEISSTDEWFKIKNITSSEINLTGWQILDKDDQIKIIFDNSNIISANGLLLLERTDETSNPDETADVIYTGALNNSNEGLYLFDNNCVLQDMVIADPDWPSINILEVTTPSDPEPELEPEPEPVESSDPAPTGEIIFNEIGWMGTEKSFDDEWIELYNPNSDTVDLFGWELIFTPTGKDPRITIFNLMGSTTPIIDGLGYFLLERKDDTGIKDINADYILDGALNNNKNNCKSLELRDNNNNLIDKVNCSQGWPAGDNTGKISMEKDADGTWRNNNLIIHNGKDAGDNNIWGTPRAKNSVSQETTITSLPFDDDKFKEITLAFQTGEFIVNGSIYIPENKKLTINPGVTLNFYDKQSRLVIDGTLKAIGTESKKILFTAYNKVDPYRGSWDEILFNSTSVGSELSNIILEYAGGGGYTTPCRHVMGGITVNETSIILRDAIIRNNQYNGIKLINSLPGTLIDNVQFLNNKACEDKSNGVSLGGAAILVTGGSPNIKHSVFNENRYGIRVEGNSLASIEDNVFEGNDKEAIYLYESSLYNMSGNTAVNNEFNGVLAVGTFMNDVVWQADLPYLIDIGVSIVSKLTIEAGAVLKFNTNASRLAIYGTLTAIGTEANKILFTSNKEAPEKGDWGKLLFDAPSVDSELDNIILEYAGGTYNRGGIEIKDSSISLKNSLIRFNEDSGIFLNNATMVYNGVQFIDNSCKIYDYNVGCIVP
ncbi:lamin tail domain-containing protein, partial [Patescibacteria group bacterium]|nr:lamin tail domain-containing protein [Patescibacteria group bacterium]